MLLVADKPAVVAESLGRLRCKLADDLDLIDEKDIKLSWIVDVRSSAGNPSAYTLSVSMLSTSSPTSSMDSGGTSLPIKCFIKKEKMRVREML